MCIVFLGAVFWRYNLYDTIIALDGLSKSSEYLSSWMSYILWQVLRFILAEHSHFVVAQWEVQTLTWYCVFFRLMSHWMIGFLRLRLKDSIDQQEEAGGRSCSLNINFIWTEECSTCKPLLFFSRTLGVEWDKSLITMHWRIKDQNSHHTPV